MNLCILWKYSHSLFLSAGVGLDFGSVGGDKTYDKEKVGPVQTKRCVVQFY